VPITGYNVYRGSANGAAPTLLTSVGPVTTFTDTTAVNGSRFVYQVSAVNAVGEGAKSNTSAATAAVLAGWRWVYFADPDGYPLELVEVAYYNEDERREGIAAYLASRP
jgi:hypothetical protein